MLPPRLRIRLKIAVPCVRICRGKVEKRDDAERHEDEAEAKALQQPGEMIGPIPMYSENPVICHIEIAVSSKPDQDDQPGVDAADQPGDEEHRDHRADAARRRHQPGRHHRIVHQILQHRRQQGHGPVERDADQEHQDRADDAIGVLQQLAVEERAVGGGRGVDDEQVEGERRRSSPRPRFRSSRTSP